MAVAIRSERVDYSISRGGGLRLWAVIFIFVLLVLSMVSLLKQADISELADALDADEDGDHDSIDDDQGHFRHGSHRGGKLTVTVRKIRDRLGKKRIIERPQRSAGRKQKRASLEN